MADRRYVPVAEQARLLRAQLKRHFPGVKFSVRSRSYAGGSSIDVKWTDGPLGSAVDAVCGPFKGGGFDGMIDMAYDVESWLCPDGSVAYAKSDGTQGSRGMTPGYSEPAPCEGAELVSFAANYVSTGRTISADVANAAIAQLVHYWGGITDAPVAVGGGYDGGFLLEPAEAGRRRIRADLDHTQDWYSMIRQAAADPLRFSRNELPVVVAGAMPAEEVERFDLADCYTDSDGINRRQSPTTPRVEVSQEIAEAFGMVGLPNLSIVK